MIYFLIIGIFLLPFILNTTNAIIPKRKLWLHPLFFLIIILALFQISLSWFTTTQINDYFVFSILSYLLLGAVVLFLITYLIAKVINHWHTISFKTIINANYSSLVFGILQAIPLIVIAVHPALIVFSDTQAYINISSYFFGNGIYSFDAHSTLDYIYTIPVGYYLNAVFSNLNYALAYRFLWVACIFYLFSWAVYYFITKKLSYFKTVYQLCLSGFISAFYVCLSFISIYIYSSGNLEIQTLFIMIAFILLTTNNAKYLWVTCFTFLLFSTTALVLSPGILIVAIVYLLVKGSWADIIIFLIGFTSILIVGIYFDLFELAPNPINYFPYFSIVSTAVMVLLPIFYIFYNKNNQSIFHYLNQPLFNSKIKTRLVSYLTKINLYNSVQPNQKWWYLSNDKLKQILFISFYVISGLIAFYVAQFIVTAIASLPANISYVSLVITGLFLILSIYLSCKKNKISKIVIVAFWFNVAFIIVGLFFHFYDNLFIKNASSWRIVYLTASVGNFCTYIILFTFLLCEVIDANKLFFLGFLNPKIRTKKIFRKQIIFYYTSIGFSFATIAVLSGASATSWVIRQNLIMQKDNQDPGITTSTNYDNQIWNPSLNDKMIFNIINQFNSNQSNSVASQDQQDFTTNILSQTVTNTKKKPKLPHFYFYSDLALSSFLNTGSPLSYGTYWNSTFCNDFIKSDTRINIVQGSSINTLLYYNHNNTVTNVNTIIDAAVQNLQNPNNSEITPSISAEYNEDLSQPITANTISVTGAPELLIFNKNTSYYKDLKISQSLTSIGQTYFADLDSDMPNVIGYKYIYSTSNTAFYVSNNWTDFITYFNNYFNNFIINAISDNLTAEN